MILDTIHHADFSQVNSMIDIIPASIYCKTLDGVYFNVNQTALDAMIKYGFLGDAISTNVMLGKTDFDFFEESIAANYRANDLETIRLRKVICIEENIRLSNGDILKQISTKKPLLNAHNEVIGILGATIIPPEKNSLLKSTFSESLTKREKDCLHLYLQGKTSKETAQLLRISHRTVEWHIENIKSKLNCNSKRDLLCFRNLI